MSPHSASPQTPAGHLSPGDDVAAHLTRQPSPSRGEAAGQYAHAPRPLRAAVFGSCVSRDTVAFMTQRAQDPWVPGPYTARQSLVSAGSPAPAGTLDLSGISSAFVRRILTLDTSCDRRALLRQAAGADVLLWDLTDERLGFFELPGGGVLTRTYEGMAAHLYDALDGARLVEWGSDEHFERWSAALGTWQEDLAATGLAGRTVLLETYWALADEEGAPTPVSNGMYAAEANWFAVRYLEAARSVAGVRTVRLPDELTVAGIRHRWGLAPFHYTDAAYRWLGESIEDLTRPQS